MDEDEIRKFWEEFDNEQQTTMDVFDDLENFTLLEEVSPWSASLETIVSTTTPTPAPDGLLNPIYQPINVTNQQWSQNEFPIPIPKPNSNGLQNQLYPNINLYENVSVGEYPQVTTSAPVDIQNQNNLITENDRPPPVELLPNPVNENYLRNDVIDSLDFLVRELIYSNRHQKATKKCEEVLSQMRLRNKMDDYLISQVLNILATVYIDLKNYGEALGILNNVLHIRRRKCGNEHLSVASVLNNIAVVHGKNGNYSDAYVLCSRSLDIILKHPHVSHMEIAKQFENLGRLDLSQSVYGSAAHYFQKALNIYKSRLGPDNPRILKIKAKIGYCIGMDRYNFLISCREANYNY